MSAVVLLLNLVGWGVLVAFVAPHDYRVGEAGVFGIGLGVTAFLLGARHAFDADHIAAIDNTARKLVGEGKPALGTGFWFSLGHSSVVFGLSLLLAIGVKVLAGPVQDESSALQHTLGVFGTLVAGSFLIVIGLMNLSALFGIVHVYRHMKAGTFDEEHLEHHLHNRGFLARIFKRTMRRVSKPWHLYPVGLLMGLGFDTATQVALLVLAGGTAAFALPWYAIMVLPVLFAAGMTLFDTARRHLHGPRLQVGLPQADPQDLLQLHRHDPVGHRGPVRSAYSCCCSSRPRSSTSPRWPGSTASTWSTSVSRWSACSWLSGPPASAPSTSARIEERFEESATSHDRSPVPRRPRPRLHPASRHRRVGDPVGPSWQQGHRLLLPGRDDSWLHHAGLRLLRLHRLPQGRRLRGHRHLPNDRPPSSPSSASATG